VGQVERIEIPLNVSSIIFEVSLAEETACQESRYVSSQKAN
jgi:hypothetical protein